MPPPTAPCVIIWLNNFSIFLKGYIFNFAFIQPRKKPRKSIEPVKVYQTRRATSAIKIGTQQDESAQSVSETSQAVTSAEESETTGGKKKGEAGSEKN